MIHTQRKMCRGCRWVLMLLVATCAPLVTSMQSVYAGAQRHKYKPTSGDFVVVCTLFNGRAPGATDSTPEEPITYDPRVDIGARVERVVLGKSPWPVGSVVTFVIHSPALMLGVGFEGKQYSLTFSRFHPTTDSDKVWFRPDTRYLLQWIEPGIERRPRQQVKLR